MSKKKRPVFSGSAEGQPLEDRALKEAALYTLAMKFLKKPQLEQIKEMMNMTILGEMIMQDGVEKGRQEGKREGRREGEAHINQLNTILIKMNRFDDLKRATQDRAYQKKLMTELLPEEDGEPL